MESGLSIFLILSVPILLKILYDAITQDVTCKPSKMEIEKDKKLKEYFNLVDLGKKIKPALSLYIKKNKYLIPILVNYNLTSDFTGLLTGDFKYHDDYYNIYAYAQNDKDFSGTNLKELPNKVPILKIIVLNNVLKELLENNEINKIFTNVILNPNINIATAAVEIYEVYNEFYADIFKTKIKTDLSIKDFETILEIFKYLINKQEKVLIKDESDLIKYLDNIDIEDYIEFGILEFNEIIKDEIDIYECDDILFLDILFSNKSKIKYAEIVNTKIKNKETEFKRKETDEKRQKLLNNNFAFSKIKSASNLKYKEINNGYEFEEHVAEIFKELGYTVENTPKSKDQGADVIVTKFGRRTVIQVKYYSGAVGNSSIQEVVAAKAFYSADECMVVTNSTFTKSAEELAKVNDVKLIDGEELNSILDSLAHDIIKMTFEN